MKVFIDTSAWVALENKKDTYYEDAITFKYEITNKRYRLYTSNFVLDETYILLLANVGYEKTVEFSKRIRVLRNEGILHVVTVAEDIEDAAWLIFKKYFKKSVIHAKTKN